MQIQILRQACCSADDQSNRLDAVLDVRHGMTIGELLQTICRSDFLQYSSTHHSLSVEVGARRIAQVRASGPPVWAPGVTPSESAQTVIGSGNLRFVFRLG